MIGQINPIGLNVELTILRVLSGKNKSGKNLVTSEKFVTFPRPIFKIKRNFMSGTAFPEKSCSVSLGFFKLSTEECTVAVSKPILLLVFKFVQFLKSRNVSFLIVFISLLLLFFSIPCFHWHFEVLVKTALLNHDK